MGRVRPLRYLSRMRTRIAYAHESDDHLDARRPGVVRQAKRAAKARRASLSSRVEGLLDESVDGPREIKESPFSRRWESRLRVIAKVEPRFDHLAAKYQLE